MKNKIILITGGTGGIGKQTALALAMMGAQVVITGVVNPAGNLRLLKLNRQAAIPKLTCSSAIYQRR